MNCLQKISFLIIAFLLTVSPTFAADSTPPTSPEVSTAMKPYVESHKTAGVIADKIGMVQCTSGDQWSARDAFLKAASEVFPKGK